VTTIEHDAAWAERVGAAVGPDSRGTWSLEVVPPEEDPASAHADPADPDAYVSASRAFLGVSFGAYACAIERFAADTLDLVLVAGRARPACLRHALAKVRRGGLVVLDHSERSWYGPALALADPAAWERTDHAGPGPYAECFWRTTILRRRA